MKLNLVTVTGADDSTPVADILKIAEEFPYAEFGILLSSGSMGFRRFPSGSWLVELVSAVIEKNLDLNLSGHLCGAWVRQFMLGNFPTAELCAIHPEFIKAGVFKRWQINTHGIPHKNNTTALAQAVTELGSRNQSVIFQHDNANTNTLLSIQGLGCKNIATLFDLSHGAGVLPDAWPRPMPDIYCGYAGGMSPENVADQLTKIEPLVGDNETWIDAETHLRTPDDQKFDLDKVRAFLTAAKPWIEKSH
jgi:hypothetical protein